MRAVAHEDDRLAELFDSNGRMLGLEKGDKISFFGELGGQGIADLNPIVFTTGTPSNRSMSGQLSPLE